MYALKIGTNIFGMKQNKREKYTVSYEATFSCNTGLTAQQNAVNVDQRWTEEIRKTIQVQTQAKAPRVLINRKVWYVLITHTCANTHTPVHAQLEFSPM